MGLVRAVTEVEHSLKATVTVNPVPGKLNVSPEYLAINALPLSLVEKSLRFQQDGNADLNVSLYLGGSEINDWISFSAVDFTVNGTDNKSIKVYINISEIGPGDYSTNIHAIAGDQDLIIPINITVTDRYKISVKIDALEKKVTAGDSVSVFTELTKTKQKKKDSGAEGRITVNLVYNVLKGKELITTFSTTMDVTNGSADTILIPIPIDVAKGRYTVEVIATHLDKTAEDRDGFLVTRNLLAGFFNLFRWFR